MSANNGNNKASNYNNGVNFRLISPKKIVKKNINFTNEIRCGSVGNKINNIVLKKPNNNTPQNNKIIICTNKNLINGYKFSEICSIHSLARQIDSSDNKNNMNMLNNSKIKLLKIKADDINKIQKVTKTPQNNNVKLELKIDNNKILNLNNKLLTPKEKYIFKASFGNISNKNNTPTNNSPQCIFNNRNNNNKTKLNQAALIYLKTDTSDKKQNNIEKNNNKIYLADPDSLLKKNAICNQSIDFGKITKNDLKNTFDIEAAKINKIMKKENSNFTKVVTIKANKNENQFIKESITNMSTNSESKYRKGKITIDSKTTPIHSINNGYQEIKNYCSEEIHFYYVNMIQEGKKLEKNIVGEC